MVVAWAGELVVIRKVIGEDAALPGTVSASFQKITDWLLVDGESTFRFSNHTLFSHGAR